ncbi:hypothetical protein HHI36_000034 [Cryptolaemus montrouzieri]|uniref:Uncharacterized protein n=1 Tax=Cryptolaemus montrouzieri TaxID=559131 RepID=A0ABD2P3J4_9CUCU
MPHIGDAQPQKKPQVSSNSSNSFFSDQSTPPTTSSSASSSASDRIRLREQDLASPIPYLSLYEPVTMSDINELNDKIDNTIRQAKIEFCPKNEKEQRISAETKKNGRT